MTTNPPDRDPDTQPIRRVGSLERRRAAVALGVLAVAALALVIVMIYWFGTSENNGSAGPSLTIPTGPAVQVTGSGSQSSPSTSSTHPRPTHTKTSTAPPSSSSPSSFSGPVSCPTAAPCSLAQDVGNVVQALNDYRTAHGAKAVPGSVTQAARDCALGNGDTSNCPSGYFWEPVGRSGAQVIQKIASGGKGTSFLLDPTLKSVEVGWAYLPSSHGYECVIVADH